MKADCNSKILYGCRLIALFIGSSIIFIIWSVMGLILSCAPGLAIDMMNGRSTSVMLSIALLCVQVGYWFVKLMKRPDGYPLSVLSLAIVSHFVIAAVILVADINIQVGEFPFFSLSHVAFSSHWMLCIQHLSTISSYTYKDDPNNPNTDSIVRVPNKDPLAKYQFLFASLVNTLLLFR
jgi:hypothetical protein